MSTLIHTTPTLVGAAGTPIADRRFLLANGFLVIGREQGCWLLLDDPQVSARHAGLAVNDEVSIRDLNSGAGTWVNNERVNGERRLVDGDIVRVPPFALRYEQVSATPASAPSFNTGGQSAGTINMVGRDQIWLKHRDSLLREIAATRTQGWRLIIGGFILSVCGGGLFAAAIMGFLSQAAKGRRRPPTTPFGPEILGVPSGLIGWVLGAVGTLLIIMGIVLHVIAVARRRQVDRDLPLSGEPS